MNPRRRRRRRNRGSRNRLEHNNNASQLYQTVLNLDSALHEVTSKNPKNLTSEVEARKENGKVSMGEQQPGETECKQKINRIQKWLEQVAQAEPTPTIEDEVDMLTQSFKNISLSEDSDVDKKERSMRVVKNPFRHSLSSNQAKKDKQHKEHLSPESRMNNFIRRVQSSCAVPEYALSDAVFFVDKPKNAISPGTQLPIMPLSEDYKVGATISLSVCEVYSPFQFWFNTTNDTFDLNLLDSIGAQLNSFFINKSLDWQMPLFFMKAGYVCVAKHEFIWKRAQIVAEPTPDAKDVSIYLVDYGKGVKVPQKDLHFLHRQFAEYPALAQRGTLSDVYPLDLHWPAEATQEFSNLVSGRELHAFIKDIDVKERILFVSLSHKKDFNPTISNLLIDAKLAGRSYNYTEEMRISHCGRRVRYIRERLPTFEMLESQVFPTCLENFEDKFDDIIYMPSFCHRFQPPKIKNPFLKKLQDALINWQVQFEPEAMAWRKLCYEAEMAREQLKRRRKFLNKLKIFQ